MRSPDALRVFQLQLKLVVPLADPMRLLSTKHWSCATPTLSEADTLIWTVPDTVESGVGPRMATVGRVVSTTGD